MKQFAEINKYNYETNLTFCSGCPELTLFDIGFCCGYEGNGCRFPEQRVKRAKSLKTLCLALIEEFNVDDTKQKEIEDNYLKKTGKP